MMTGPLQASPVPSAWLWTAAVLAAGLFSFGVAIRLATPGGAWGRRLRSRFVLGVPWGTVLVCLVVLAVYLFVQDGIADLSDPVVVPFMAWGYGYPLGMLTAGLAHANLGHLTGNLLGTLTFAPIAEYAWSHFPQSRGRQSFGRARDNPFVRILGFAGGVLVVAVATSLFGWGPVIGFSGAVFAFVGYALVSYPIVTVVALSAGSVLRLVYRALRQPVLTAEAGPEFSSPWWAGIAVQGHAIGLLFGVVVGGYVGYRRASTPSAGRLWLATVVVAVAQSLWAVYWFLGEGRYVLFRAAGVALVFALAALVTAALTADDAPLVPRIDLSGREAAALTLGAVVLALSLTAVPTNVITVENEFEDGVQVEDYTVTYAEDVPDQYVSPFNVNISNPRNPLEDPEPVTTSGVIVVSEQRQTFHTIVPKQRLAFDGEATVTVGGLGWREDVGVNRTTWQPVGNDSVYTVRLAPPDGERRLAYVSEPATAEPRIDGRAVQLRADGGQFTFAVRRDNGTLGTTPVPAVNETATAGGLVFNRTERRVYAERNGTRVRIARLSE